MNDDAHDGSGRAWRVALGAAKLAGEAALAAGRAAGGAAAGAWRQVDPDTRRHLVELPLMGVTLLTPRAAPVEAMEGDGHRPVVFVHGLGGARGNFLPMRGWFRAMGRRRTYAVGFPGGEPVEALAARLAAYVREVIDVNGLHDEATVDVVAHSMGGVIARLALDDAWLRGRVSSLVTLGTPHGGTWAARYAGAAPAVQLRPDGDVVAHLAAQWRARESLAWPRTVCLWSRADVLMLPAETAALEGAECVELEGLTHNGLLLHPRAWQRAYEAIDRR